MSTTVQHTSPARTAVGIDPRGPQFAAAITAGVLVATLVTAPSGFATALLAVQTALFAIGAIRGVQQTPLAFAFRTFVRPRLSAPDELEDPAPPRFAQTVGFSFGVIGLAGFLGGADALGLIAVGFALIAALLNAIFRFCLGCEMYLLLKRLQPNAA